MTTTGLKYVYDNFYIFFIIKQHLNLLASKTTTHIHTHHTQNQLVSKEGITYFSAVNISSASTRPRTQQSKHPSIQAAQLERWEKSVHTTHQDYQNLSYGVGELQDRHWQRNLATLKGIWKNPTDSIGIRVSLHL